jgi:GNAT superfamily N-acetyltransferase
VVRLLADGEEDDAAMTLGRAFADTPLMVHAIPEAGPRREVAPMLMRPGVRLARLLGEVWCTDDLAAVACWRRPGSGRPTEQQQRDAGFAQLPQPVTAQLVARTEPSYAFLAARRDALGVPAEHWYCTMVGVVPERWRTGLGSAVLAPVLRTAATRGEPVFLETMRAENCGFYLRNGFSCLEAGVEPATGLGYWLYLRTGGVNSA